MTEGIKLLRLEGGQGSRINMIMWLLSQLTSPIDERLVGWSCCHG